MTGRPLELAGNLSQRGFHHGGAQELHFSGVGICFEYDSAE
jgi:hypothetical protein